MKIIETDGYLRVARVFSTDEVKEMLAWIPAIRGIAGTRNLLELPECVALAADSRIAKLVGADARPVRAILFDKNPSVNWNLGWHQDTKIAVLQRSDVPGFTNWSTKEG
ncbi:MAG: phytanoyl-CoA dioxygenase, partial [Armatimonadetes bacterium]|nr:phytanoyl-CoA dioxygenase [Armatimonadota bacterium]